MKAPCDCCGSDYLVSHDGVCDTCRRFEARQNGVVEALKAYNRGEVLGRPEKEYTMMELAGWGNLPKETYDLNHYEQPKAEV